MTGTPFFTSSLIAEVVLSLVRTFFATARRKGIEPAAAAGRNDAATCAPRRRSFAARRVENFRPPERIYFALSKREDRCNTSPRLHMSFASCCNEIPASAAAP
jgi:hypothetical protein